MGIFDSNKSQTSKLTTNKLYFGAPEAEAENIEGKSLTDYFEDFLDVLDSLKKGKFVFVGRKGVGKSAIVKYIKDSSDKSDDSFACKLRLSDFHLESIVQMINKNDVEVLLFEWLILLNLTKLIVKSQAGKYTNEYEKLAKFVENNTGSVDIDKFQIDEKFIQNGGEISFGVLTHCFGGILKKHVDVKTTKAPFYRLIAPIKEIIKRVLAFQDIQKFEYWILFDDLDIDYSIHNEKDDDKIINLLRIAKEYNNEILNQKSRILVFIRDDVRNHIVSKYSDSAKIFNSYEVLIDWYSRNLENKNENLIALKQLANKRIELSLSNNSISRGSMCGWDFLFPDSPISYKTSFKYVLDYTFYRPRDIVTFLKCVSDNYFEIPVSRESLKDAINGYITATIDELQSELGLYFSSNEKNILFDYVLRFVAKGQDVQLSEVRAVIAEKEFQYDVDKVIDLLFDYSLLTVKNSEGQPVFSYRERKNKIIGYSEDPVVSLHKCVYHYYKQLR